MHDAISITVPVDPAADRITRARLSLEGLSCGDAFGECFFLTRERAMTLIEGRTAPPGPWVFTDDTLMAISIVDTLRVYGEIVEPQLATHFASLYDPSRGYGAAMRRLLQRIGVRGGEFWREESISLFEGGGSFGNGSAMRVAPLGAYFADDLDRVIEQAERSALVTHAHLEAVAGAIAVAMGAALAWKTRDRADAPSREEFLGRIREAVPASAVRNGIEQALRLQADATVEQAVAALGNGTQVSAADTVPFVLWSVGRSFGSYEEAIWQTVSGFGDCDTTCAMVGGIVVMRTGISGVPAEWMRRREPLPSLSATEAEPS